MLDSFLDKTSKWISTKVRKPMLKDSDNNKNVLVPSLSGLTCAVVYFKIAGMRYTHWMPLPNPPKE